MWNYAKELAIQRDACYGMDIRTWLVCHCLQLFSAKKFWQSVSRDMQVVGLFCPSRVEAEILDPTTL